MNRFYVNSGDLFLAPEDVHHARDVLRLKPGDPVELIQDEKRFLASVVEITGDRVRLERGEVLPSTEPDLHITLYQGLPKGDKMEWIIQKAVELGVRRIVPVQMDRCVVRLKASDADRKTARWQKIAREAGKQSGRCIIPDVYAPISLKELASVASSLQAAVVPWEQCRAGGPKAFAAAHPGLTSLGILIGPEGGITPEEISFLIRSGFQPVTLGPRILRTETAGLAAVSAFSALYGEME